MDMTKGGMTCALLLAALAGRAYDFKVAIDPSGTRLESAPQVAVPAGAETAYARYAKMAEGGHTVVLAPALSAADGNALASAPKGVGLAVRATKQLNSFVLLMANTSAKTNVVAVEIAGRRKLPPNYRRVYHPAGSSAWDTLAWEPPQSSGRVPWTVELPPQTAQTVTIKTK